ncbi:anionic trypsin-2-like [Labrus mixtus]|uniref:anionic trypsin-2-like n=1 Tax=Labrus mixtus TaxID=508554 RepID=UPI0029BFAD3E|nr:anionic trypsin-2-like [Labrus mixtus]
MGGMTRLLLLLCAGVTASTAVDLQKRIVGGRPCPKKTRDYHVYVEGFNGSHYFMCGGSLISDRWILTAAHCLKRDVTAYVGPGLIKMDIIQHETFKENGNGNEHDLMLLKLRDSTQIQPVKFPTTAECAKRTKLQTVEIAGYASKFKGPNNERGDDRPQTLQCADIPVVSCETSRKCLQDSLHPDDLSRLYQRWFCGQSDTVDISLGDSGGGVVHGSKIYGVISFTMNGTHACVAPAAFMDVCQPRYKDWIRRMTGLRTI